MTTALPRPALPVALVVLAGGLIAMLSFGPRSSLGLFAPAFSSERGWSIEVFSAAAAVQNLLWGLGQPFAGALADRYGTLPVLIGGSLLYAAGLAWMAVAPDPLGVGLSAGVLVGLGLAGCSFNLVLGAFGKLVPEGQRSMAFGIGSAAGSFGQFLFLPLSAGLITAYGWSAALVVFALLMLLCVPLSLALATRPAPPEAAAASAPREGAWGAVRAALRHRSYALLVAGFFVCGFHLAFITIHLPKYLLEKGLTLGEGGTVLALVGLFNVVGSLASGYLGSRFPKRWLLAGIYAARGVAIALFALLPVTATSAMLFGAAMGLLWLSTVPLTSGLVVVMFGPRFASTLYGVAFLSHQLGSFLALILAGSLRESTGSYDVLWALGVALAVAAALVNLPIVERPAARLVPAAA